MSSAPWGSAGILPIFSNGNAGTSGAGSVGAPASYAESATTIPTGEWVCLALSISQSGATGAVKLFVKDVEVADVTAGAAGTPSMSHVYLGLDWVGNPASFAATDVWIDEVVINDSPVTCSM